MVLLLILDVVDHRAELRSRIGESAESFLPCEAAKHPALLVNPTGGVGLDVTHEFGERRVRTQADEQMHMVRHVVYRNQLVPLRGNDAGDVFLEFVVVFRCDEALPAFHGKHDMDVNLRIGIRHAPTMPLLTEIGNLFLLVLQRWRP